MRIRERWIPIGRSEGTWLGLNGDAPPNADTCSDRGLMLTLPRATPAPIWLGAYRSWCREAEGKRQTGGRRLVGVAGCAGLEFVRRPGNGLLDDN